ncbi:MAG: SRPBCC family protein [Rhabdochlamydiaceae bacterium]
MTKSSRTKVTAEPGKQEVFITREFDAPRELVFRAFTDPKLCARWLLGPKKLGLTMTVEKFEPKSGGSWRYKHRDQNGNEFAFHGSYHEVLAPELLIDTFEFEGMPEKGHVSLETARFEELPSGRTRLTIHTVFQSVADRDGMLQSGMEDGLDDSLDRLEDLVEEFRNSSS